jgi:hypothetical protein
MALTLDNFQGNAHIRRLTTLVSAIRSWIQRFSSPKMKSASTNPIRPPKVGIKQQQFRIIGRCFPVYSLLMTFLYQPPVSGARSASPRCRQPLWLTLLVATSCSNTDFTSQDQGGVDLGPLADYGAVADLYQNPCAPDPPPSVSGKVYAPNGLDPVAGASVHVLLAATPLSSSVTCETCEVHGKFGAQVYTNADGSFTLTKVPHGPFVLGLQKGHFRRVLKLDLPSCGHLSLGKDQTTLPGKNAQWHELDTVPSIAVVSGAWDKLEKVLDKLGLQEKTVYNGKDYGTGPQSVQALLQNGAKMQSHHMILIDCGTKFEALVTSSTDPIARNNLRSYVAAGGRLFVTDLSYDYVEQTFPEFIDFEGSEKTGKDTPEEPGGAELGAEIASLRATLLDGRLKAWLGLPEINALLPSSEVEIKGFLTGWAVQKAVNTDLGAKVWVQAPVTWVGGTGVRPLTVSYDYRGTDGAGCGRVLFTSYHTHGDGPELLPQERILEYMLLEIGACATVE